MHTLAQLSFIFFSYKLGDTDNWRRYHTTLLYICALNLLYNFLAANYDLWKYEPDFFSNHSLTEVGNSVILLPAIAFLFLSNYPENLGRDRVILYYAKWVISSVIIEGVFVYFDKITFHHGYQFWMEPFFYILMYGFIRLHHQRPVLTYFLSIVVVLLFILGFDVPVATPINARK